MFDGIRSHFNSKNNLDHDTELEVLGLCNDYGGDIQAFLDTPIVENPLIFHGDEESEAPVPTVRRDQVEQGTIQQQYDATVQGVTDGEVIVVDFASRRKVPSEQVTKFLIGKIYADTGTE